MPRPAHSRKGIYGPNVNNYSYSENVLYNLRIGEIEVTIFEGSVPEDKFGPNIILHIKTGTQKLTTELTDLNFEEVNELRTLLTKVLPLVEVIAIGRDKAARDYEEQSDTRFFKRLYRPVPAMAETTRAKRINLQSILQRPKTVSKDDGSADDFLRGIRGASG